MPVSEVLEEPCPDCGGRGWVVAADGRAGTALPCACRRRDVVPRLIAAAGIPSRYKHCRLGNFHVSSRHSRVDKQLQEDLKASATEERTPCFGVSGAAKTPSAAGPAG